MVAVSSSGLAAIGSAGLNEAHDVTTAASSTVSKTLVKRCDVVPMTLSLLFAVDQRKVGCFLSIVIKERHYDDS